MKKLTFQQFLLPCAVAAVLGIASAVFIHAGSILHRVANGLFFGGMGALMVGIFYLLKRLGPFDSFLYSHLRISQVISKGKKERAIKTKAIDEADEDPQQQVNSYYEYLQDKAESKPCTAPLLVGAVLLAASFAVSFI